MSSNDERTGHMSSNDFNAADVFAVTWDKARYQEQPLHWQTASEKARFTGDLASLRVLESRGLFATANRTSVARMFLELGLANKIVNAIVDK